MPDSRRPRHDDVRLVVAMLTYLRTAELPSSIDAVLRAIEASAWEATLLVVDNDPQGSAMGLEGRWAQRPVRFVHEPEPGISAARNRALDEAADEDVLVFIDDDERPHEGWLDALMATWEDTGADAVVGPVVSLFPEDPERWITEGEFFVRRRLPTGTQVSMAATNNLLLDVQAIQARDLRFDLAFGIIGGSDSVFTQQLHRDGGRMIWCDEAVVDDVVPAERMTRKWVMQRALRLGNSASLVVLALEASRVRRSILRLRLTGRGTVRLIGGSARMLLGWCARSVRHRARGARTFARGLGMVGGAWGFVYAEYERRSSARRRLFR